MAKQNNEKTAVLAVGVFIALVLLIYVSYKVTSSASMAILGLVIVVAEYAVIIPMINKLYHEYHEYEAPLTRYVPIYNELMLFSGWIYNALIALTIAFVVLLLLTSPLAAYIPLSPGIIVNLTSYGLFAAIGVGAVICIIRGIGFSKIKHEVDYSIMEVFDKSPGVVDYAIYASLFFPIIRCVGLAYMLSYLKRLELNDISSDFEAVEDDEEGLYEYEE